MIDAPFKCVGGKGKMVERLRTFLPADYVGYAEPFLGGGALFRALASTGDLQGKSVLLSDFGYGAAMTWQAIQQDAAEVQARLDDAKRKYDAFEPAWRKHAYLTERTRWNRGEQSAARHIFLRNLAFNGLWRENQKGGFNVPWGRYVKLRVPNLLPLGEALQGDVEVRHAGFQEVVPIVPPGWVLYIDPPYLQEFDMYTKEGFSLAMQVELLQMCRAAKQREVHVIYSNRYFKPMLDLLKTHWPEGTPHRAVISQTIAAKSTARGAVEELVVT